MLKRKYRLGLSTTVDYTVPLEKQLEVIAAGGFDFISLGANVGHSRYFDPEIFGNYQKLAVRYSLEIKSAHVPFADGYDIAAMDHGAARKAVANVLGFLELTEQYAIPAVILHPHYYFSDDKESCLKRAIYALEIIVNRGSNRVRLDIENLPDHRGSWICGQLLDYFGADVLGFCYDSSHENMSGPPFHLLQNYWARITQTHLSDNKGVNDDHLIPGDGNIDWPAMRTWLEKNRALTEVLFEVGTGEKLVEPFASFMGRAASAARRFFG